MRKLIPMLLIGFFLHEEVQAQCNASFYTSINGATIQVQAADSSLYLIHNWIFGDSTQGWGPNVYHTYSLPGTYVVKHIVVDSLNNCRDTAQQAITVSFTVNCSASFITTKDTLSPNNYHFYSNSTVGGGSIQSYNWTVNGDTVSTASAFAWPLPQGLNFVCLTIQTTAGCTASKCDSIWVDTTVNCNLSATFTATASSQNPAQISFTPSPLTPGLSYSWNFGDGHISFSQTPIHIYNSPGTYGVILTIVDSATWCYDSVRQYIVIQRRDSCTASFITTKDTLSPHNYLFYSNSTVGGGSIQSYNWTVNGNTVSTASAFSWPLPQGLNFVCLTIQTTAGCISSKCDSIWVDTTVNCNLSASFTATPDSLNPRKISFTPSPLTPGLSYSWNFGDGHVSFSQTPIHIYNNPGTYGVILTIVDSATWCYDSVRQYIVIPRRDSCTASFTYTVNPSQPNQLSFTAISNETIVSWYWFIQPCDSSSTPSPDSVFYNTANPVHTFSNPGCYRVCLQVLTNTGCRKYYCNTVIVNDSAGAKLITSYPNPVQGSNVHLRLDLEQAAKVKLTVFNSYGNMVYTNEKTWASGQNKISIPVDKLQRGLYFIDIQYGNIRKRSVFQKL